MFTSQAPVLPALYGVYRVGLYIGTGVTFDEVGHVLALGLVTLLRAMKSS